MVNKITSPITPLGEIDKINEVIDEVDKKLENTATGTGALTINGTPSAGSYAVNIGDETASTANYSTAIGYKSKATASSSTAIGRVATAGGSYSIAIGYGATISNAGGKSIQLGYGTNGTAASLSVGFQGEGNYQLLDGTTGKIPSDRIKYDGTTITVNANGELTSTGGGGGSSRQIGEIVTSTIPLTDAGLHLLNGGKIYETGIYADFYAYMDDLYTADPTANYFCSEADWQTSDATYGVCGKFAFGSDAQGNYVRLPKYSNKIYTQELDATAPVVGNGMSLGLTNGTVNTGLSHNTASPYHLGGAPTGYGASVGANAPTTNALGSQIAVGITSDASYSGIIAQLSNITTALDGYYYIVVATTTKTEIEVDIDEIATDLNGKADTDLTNVANTAGFRRLIEVSPTSILPSWYKVFAEYDPTTGNFVGNWCEQGGTIQGIKAGFVQLLKQYTSANNYRVLMGWDLGSTTSTDSDGYSDAPVVSNRTTESFRYNIVGTSTAYRVTWQACGYIS